MGGCGCKPLEAHTLLGPVAEWGSIDDVLNAPPDVVSGEHSWISVVLLWITLPLNLIQAILGGTCQGVYRWFSYTALQSLQNGKPFWEWYIWWRYTLATIISLLLKGKSRLKLFMWEREAWGGGDYFAHGEGLWLCPHAAVDAVMASNQPRVPAFGCIAACSPDLFPKGLLLFLPNTGPDSEWGQLRSVLHRLLLETSGFAWKDRLAALPRRLAGDWPSLKLSHMDDITLLNRMVAKSIWFLILGSWLSDDEANSVTGWRTLAPVFVLPRMLQRLAFNLGLRKVKQLRRDTVQLIEQHKLQEIFQRFNQELPESYRRKTVVQLCDEIMYVVGFAGIGGTCACVENVCAFLQVKLPEENRTDHVDFSRYSTEPAMLAAYKANPVAYIKETCRLMPPVTSCTAPLPEDTTLNMGGVLMSFPKGTLRQLTLSLANRDPMVFKDPTVFEPKRPELDRALTWNGAFGMPNDESNYPRLCPGRHVALEVAQAIINHAIAKS